MEVFLEILKFTLPSFIMFLVVWVMMRNFTKAEDRRRKYLIFKESQKTTLPVRLTAYERLVLLMERISPDSMLVRLQQENQNALMFHAALLTDIRAEFEHNLTQQVYVTDEAWSVVKNAKESIVQLVNTCASHVKPTDSSVMLAQLILKAYETAEQSPTELAIKYLKSEIKNYF